MNKICLVGRLTKDVELKYTPNNMAIGRFTLAVNRQYSKEGQQTADFIPTVVFGKVAENCSKYIGKGRLVSVSGRLQSRTWDDQDGKRHYMYEVAADEVQFLDRAKEEQDFTPSNEPDPFGEDDGLPF